MTNGAAIVVIILLAVFITTARLQPTEAQKTLKFYAVHIGPSKTGTTAIQGDLRSNPFGVNTLAETKDNVIYVGKRSTPVWTDIDARTEVRTINGTSINPTNEKDLYSKAVDCMVQKLKNYYDSHNTEDIDDINRRLEEDEETRASLKLVFTNECWAQVKIRTKIGSATTMKICDARYMLDYSILDSDEAYSFYEKKDYSHFDVLGKRFRCFDILGYKKLVLVGAYRRFADWSVSAYTQSIKIPCLRPNLEGNLMTHTCNSLKRYLTQLLKRTGDQQYNCMSYNNIHISLPKIEASGPSKLETKVLNYFQLPHPTSDIDSSSNNDANAKGYDSITTELYCDALGEELTPHTCHHAQTIASSSLSLSSSSSSSLVRNKGSTPDSVYQSIVSTAHLLGFINPTDQVVQSRKQKCSKKFWCVDDASCVDNTKKCDKLNKERPLKREAFLEEYGNDTLPVVVGNTTSKITTWKDLSDYHSRDRGLAWTDTLPVECPSPTKLDKLLKRSLEFEQLVMPEFYATPLGREELERLFNDVWLEEKKLFCWVDLHRLFRNASSWDEIINERMVNYNWTVSYEKE